MGHFGWSVCALWPYLGWRNKCIAIYSSLWTKWTRVGHNIFLSIIHPLLVLILLTDKIIVTECHTVFLWHWDLSCPLELCYTVASLYLSVALSTSYLATIHFSVSLKYVPPSTRANLDEQWRKWRVQFLTSWAFVISCGVLRTGS